MDKTLGLSAERSGVRIPGQGKCSLRTIAVDARVKYPLYIVSLTPRLPIRKVRAFDKEANIRKPLNTQNAVSFCIYREITILYIERQLCRPLKLVEMSEKLAFLRIMGIKLRAP